jgi:hypothetical protein
MEWRKKLERAFKQAAKRGQRRGYPMPSFCDQPSWVEFTKEAGKLESRYSNFIAQGVREGRLYKELVGRARYFQLLHMKAAISAYRGRKGAGLWAGFLACAVLATGSRGDDE